jgi:hypothetical protein
MIRGKPGEGLRGGHRKAKRPTTVNRGGLNIPRVSSDLEVNLEGRLHPIRDRIGSSLPVRPAKAAAGATRARRREIGTNRSAVISGCRGGVLARVRL